MRCVEPHYVLHILTHSYTLSHTLLHTHTYTPTHSYTHTPTAQTCHHLIICILSILMNNSTCQYHINTAAVFSLLGEILQHSSSRSISPWAVISCVLSHHLQSTIVMDQTFQNLRNCKINNTGMWFIPLGMAMSEQHLEICAAQSPIEHEVKSVCILLKKCV